MADWPAWATEKVQVGPPDASWQQRGERERRLLNVTTAAVADQDPNLLRNNHQQ